MTTGELYKYLDTKIDKNLSEEWDNDGCMLLPSDKTVKKVLIALDVTPRVAAEAIDGGYDLIVTHHPMIFHPLKGISNEKIISLVKHDISVFSFHTRLDSLDGGVNDTAADLLGLHNVVPFDTIGRVGELRIELKFEELCKLVKEKFLAPSLTYIKNCDKVKRITLLGGDGKDFWQDAVELSDVYITGNMSYNSMLEAYEAGASIIEAGHFFTEFPVCGALEAMIQSVDSAIKTHIMLDYPIMNF